MRGAVAVRRLGPWALGHAGQDPHQPRRQRERDSPQILLLVGARDRHRKGSSKAPAANVPALAEKPGANAVGCAHAPPAPFESTVNVDVGAAAAFPEYGAIEVVVVA